MFEHLLPGQANTVASPRARADSSPYGVSGKISSAPWEGLYLEEVKPEIPPRSELDKFLASLCSTPPLGPE
jgi:hypothetical protein